MQQPGEVHPLGLPVVVGVLEVEDVRPPNHLVYGPESEICHDLPHLFSDEREVGHEMLWLAGELLPQLRILGGDTHGAGVHMAFSEHDAAADHQSRGREPVFFGAQKCGHHGIPASLQLTVGLHHYSATQSVGHQYLLGLGDAQFPGQSCVLDGRLGRSSGAAVVATDQHHIGMALGHTRGDGADADLRHQLHVNPGIGVNVLQVMNQLGQVFDGIYVMVGRRRDQFDARRGLPNPADILVDLVAWQLSALAGFGALGHLDLEIGGVYQIVGGHAEPARGYLFHRAAT